MHHTASAAKSLNHNGIQLIMSRTVSAVLVCGRVRNFALHHVR